MIIVMCGISGSGKSEEALSLAKKYNAVIHSSDSLRKEIFGNESNQDHNGEVFDELHKRIKVDIDSGKDIIVDATSITIKSRARFRDYKCRKIAYILTTSEELAKSRNKNRKRVVPDEVIDSQIARFQIPFVGEFDQIVFSDRAGYRQEEFESKMKGFDQRTKWHKYPLEEHCRLCSEEVAKRSDNKDLILAASLHDYGKLFTQTFENGNDAHYYNHHNVGAHKLLRFLDPEVLFYINYHMLPFAWSLPQTHEKYKRIFGEEKYNNLILFNACDRIASGTR